MSFYLLFLTSIRPFLSDFIRALNSSTRNKRRPDFKTQSTFSTMCFVLPAGSAVKHNNGRDKALTHVMGRDAWSLSVISTLGSINEQHMCGHAPVVTLHYFIAHLLRRRTDGRVGSTPQRYHDWESPLATQPSQIWGFPWVGAAAGTWRYPLLCFDFTDVCLILISFQFCVMTIRNSRSDSALFAPFLCSRLHRRARTRFARSSALCSVSPRCISTTHTHLTATHSANMKAACRPWVHNYCKIIL